MTEYMVWYEQVEVKTESGKSWSEKELLDAYNQRTSCDPRIIGRYNDKDEALEHYHSTESDCPYEQRVTTGTVLEYEVVGIDWAELDDSGCIDCGTLELKAMPYNAREEK